LILKRLDSFIGGFLLKGHERTVKAKKNILASFGIQGFSILLGFIKVPIILTYLDVEKYGVWLTIASIVDWVQYFDLGIGHGLRNKFAEAIAVNDQERAKKLVSTAYYYISLIFLGAGLIITPLIFFLDWQKILNVQTIENRELLYSVIVVLFMFVFRFVFNLISVILKADQKPALSDAFLPVSSIITLALIILLRSFTENSLFLACLAIAIPPTLVLLFANFFFFHRLYARYKPSIKNVDKTLFKDIFSLGFRFFFLQMGGLVMFSSSNIILTQVVNPSEVTLYNITRQYFGVPMMAFGIILAPFWSAITDANIRGENQWIKKVMNKLLLLSALFSFGIIIMLICSEFVYKIWLGDKVNIPFKLSLMMSLYSVFLVFFSPFSHFINGVGKLMLGMRVVLIKIILFLPVAVIFTQWWGSAGLILTFIIVNSIPSAIIETRQYYLIINDKAHGIWNR
jgi:O-antigen/teichoic acid export membrane protein